MVPTDTFGVSGCFGTGFRLCRNLPLCGSRGEPLLLRCQAAFAGLVLRVRAICSRAYGDRHAAC